MIPKQLHVFSNAAPLTATRAILQLDGLFVNLGPKRIRIDTLHKFEEGAIANIVSLKEKNQALYRAIEIYPTGLLRLLLENRVHPLGHLEVLRLNKSLEQALDT